MRSSGLLLSGALLAVHSPVSAQCRLCAPSPPNQRAEASRPLDIEVETSLDFSRAAANGRGGSIDVDAQSGTRRIGGLTDLGGLAIKGSVRLTGEPFRHVRVSLPPSVRLLAPDGAGADAVDLRTDLPPDPMLGADGTLRFSFGGRLILSGNAAGDFRGRIAIVADYQ